MRVQRTVCVTEEQANWLKINFIKLSRFIQSKIDEEIIKRKIDNHK